MKIFVLLVLISATLAGENIVNLASDSPRLLLNLFNEFEHDTGRSFPASERRLRYTLFKKSISDAARWNAEEPDVEYGLTVFSGLTDAEMDNMLGLNSTKHHDTPLADVPEPGLQAFGSTSHKPLYGPAKDQKNTMACWAFTATAVLEGYTSKFNKGYLALSEQETADCTPGSTVARGGYHGDALEAIKKQNHLTYAANLPFTFKQGKCNTRHQNGLNFRITKVTEFQNDKNLKNALRSGPVAAAMKFSKRLGAYRGGIYLNPECNKMSSPNHAITIVGYTRDAWEIRNSYGARGWGEQGYGRFTRSIDNMCNLSGWCYYIDVQKNRMLEQEE